MPEALRLISPGNGLQKQARAAVQKVAAKRGGIPAELVEEAAVLLADLWAAAMRRGFTPGGRGERGRLAGAALDTVIAEHRPKRGGSKR
jgi:hypothetical protein